MKPLGLYTHTHTHTGILKLIIIIVAIAVFLLLNVLSNCKISIFEPKAEINLAEDEVASVSDSSLSISYTGIESVGASTINISEIIWSDPDYSISDNIYIGDSDEGTFYFYWNAVTVAANSEETATISLNYKNVGYDSTGSKINMQIEIEIILKNSSSSSCGPSSSCALKLLDQDYSNTSSNNDAGQTRYMDVLVRVRPLRI